MEATNLFDKARFSSAQHVKTVIKEAEKYKILVIGLEPGQQIPPCVMHSHTIFYVIEGQGSITAGGEKSEICRGSMIVLPPGVERSVTSSGRMTLLAIQVH